MGTGGWVLLERGTLVCWGDKSREEVEEEKVGGLLLSCRLPDFGIQVDEDSSLALLRQKENQESHQESAGHALPGLTPWQSCALCSESEGYRELAAGEQEGLWGCISQGLAPGTRDRTAPQKHPSYAGWAGSQHPSHLRLRSQPGVPLPASCLHRKVPAGRGSGTCLRPESRRAGSCLLPGAPAQHARALQS